MVYSYSCDCAVAEVAVTISAGRTRAMRAIGLHVTTYWRRGKPLTSLSFHSGMALYGAIGQFDRDNDDWDAYCERFDLSSAPSIFQSTMEGIVVGIPNVVVYIDDILAVGSSEEDHLRTLDIVLKQLEDAGLRLKLAKCAFMMDQLEYLGHLISGNGIQPTEDKKQAILEAPTPQNLQQLRSFLGLLNYYGKFLPNLASILSPLYSAYRRRRLDGTGGESRRKHLAKQNIF